MALCAGEVAHLGRVWADGQLLDTEGRDIRFYPGSEEQQPDSLIEARQGAGNAPAYRGLCYLVFEDLALTDFGNRIPNITVEVCRVVGALEPAVRAVTVIPGATEFGYDPSPRVRMLSPGVTGNENAHLYADASDWTVSLDQLQALCPNLEHVSLVVAWFGDDLRCGTCSVRPRVVRSARRLGGADWRVSGIGRAGAVAVSQHGGGPAYGGTPGDGSVRAAIADLRARGLKVTLYPIVMMDIPTANALENPYTGAAPQPAYPWRGRITSDPAPGLPGTPDTTAALAGQVAAFVGTARPGDFTPAGSTVNFSGGADWGYRRMILHYAHLAAAAGGVDALILGSEMKGLTALRSAPETFPFVDALVDLAADVRAVVGPDTKLTYAADWSEYSGYQPPHAPGDKLFHLDPLWASPAIDAIGIDNYMPVADWRDGAAHADVASARDIYDTAYLQANIAGGENYDWYYASEADRIAQARTPIRDSAHGEPWIWRSKDIASWWRNAHHNRIDGVRAAAPTAFVPQSKPIWFTELGCGAVDKGANRPSAFSDAKSAEDARPWFSNGAPDALMQRQVLRAHLGWWTPGGEGFDDARNPLSAVYGGRMVDPERIFLWTWDARAFPAFPELADVWSDAANYATGHWLTGRLGGMAADELVAAMARDFGVDPLAADAVPPLVHGARIDRVGTLRDALGDLLEVADLSIRDRPAGLMALRPAARAGATIAVADMVRDEGSLTTRKRPDPGESVGRLALTYTGRTGDYRAATATALAPQGEGGKTRALGLTLDRAGARRAAETMLAGLRGHGDTLALNLPPSRVDLEPGDVVAVEGQGDGPFVITELRDAGARRVAARALALPRDIAVTAAPHGAPRRVAAAGAVPVFHAAWLPAGPAAAAPPRLAFGAFADPWPGAVNLVDTVTGRELARPTSPASLGELAAPLGEGPTAVWDRGSVLDVVLYGGHLASAAEGAVLAGTNRLAVRHDAGGWEILGFTGAQLVAPGRYRLTGLLRGLGGSLDGLAPSAQTGNPVLILDDAVVWPDLPGAEIGSTLDLTVYAGRSDADGAALGVTLTNGPVRPLAPVHLSAVRDRATGDIALSWVRRGRVEAESWGSAEIPLDYAPEAYRVSIGDGAAILRTLEATTSSVLYAAAQQQADFEGPAAAFTYSVAQLSAVYGAGHAARGVFSG